MTVLSVTDLDVSIGGTNILRGVSFDIEAGSRFGVVGESGCGKSMTALSIMGLPPPEAVRAGSAELAGCDLLALSEPEMCKIRGREIGMIFQEPMTALNPVRTIGDQVAETLMVHLGIGRREALDIAAGKLERVGMPTSRFPMDLFAHELSGGQRQRVCIAMAIALMPKLLIADEPTTALDVSTQSRILELLSSLVADDGMSLMLITHDLAVIAQMTDRTMVMNDGVIVEMDETASLFRRRRHHYTRQLLAASSWAPERSGESGGECLLLVRDVVREYARPVRFLRKGRRLRAVDRVSFKLRRGESLGLVGESGCGKSSLARAILGLDPLQEGQVTVSQAPVDRAGGLPIGARRRIQAVFQDPYGSFNPRHRVERLVGEPLYLLDEKLSRNRKRQRVADAIEDVGLSASDMQKFIHQFSGGQRQRIAIARALVLRPDIIVLDEAVSALDVSIRSQILELLDSLQQAYGLSYLLISHDLTVVRAVTDRVLVMQEGRVVEEGRTADVLTSPRHDHTKSLLAAAPSIPGEWLR